MDCTRKWIRTEHEDREMMERFRLDLERRFGLSQKQIVRAGLDNPQMSEDARRVVVSQIIRDGRKVPRAQGAEMRATA